MKRRAERICLRSIRERARPVLCVRCAVECKSGRLFLSYVNQSRPHVVFGPLSLKWKFGMATTGWAGGSNEGPAKHSTIHTTPT